QAMHRTRAPSVFQSEPTVVCRSSAPASDALATRDFASPGVGEAVAMSLLKLLAVAAGFMVCSSGWPIKFVCLQAIVKKAGLLLVVQFGGARPLTSRLARTLDPPKMQTVPLPAYSEFSLTVAACALTCDVRSV